MSQRPNTYLALLLGTLSACESTVGPHPQRVDFEAVTPATVAGVVGTQIVPIPTVRAVAEDGRPLPGITVSFSLTGNGTLGRATALTDSAGNTDPGMWQLGPSAGQQTLTASAAGRTVIFTAVAEPGPVASLAVVGGEGQIATAGFTLQHALSVRAVDTFANPVTGAAVSFSVISGGGSIFSGLATTGPDGVAFSGIWTLGTVVGPQQVRARSGGADVVFTAEACEPRSCPQLLFVGANPLNRPDIVVYDFGVRDTRQLTFDGRSVDPAWSPDGRRIAFARYTPSRDLELYLMDADGSNAARLTSGLPLHSPSWSPAGDAIALAGGHSLCVYECGIYVLALTGAGGTLRHIAEMGADPAWSPDGSRIAFVGLSGDDGYQTLRVMNADGSANRELTPIDEGAIYRPTWSPDGQRIAFSKCIGGGCDILVVNADGSGLTGLTRTRNAQGPAWSPDGTRIAFSRWDPGSSPSIAWIPAAGGEPITLIFDAHSPTWRP
jgi:hypothetical protein